MIFPIPISVHISYALAASMAWDVYSLTRGRYSRIDHAAHLGGALTGVTAGYFWKEQQKRKMQARRLVNTSQWR